MENLSDYNFSTTEQVLLINNGDDDISIVYSIVCYYLRFTNFMYNFEAYMHTTILI